MTSWIHLDPAIRDYVLLPIFAVVVLTSVLRTSLTKLAGKPAVKAPELSELKFLALFQRAARFRMHRNWLSSNSFESKKALFLNPSGKKGPVGLLQAEAPAQLSAMEKMMQQNQDPSQALNMVKSQFMFLGLHGGLGYWVSHLFSGFLVAKTPFPLTFKIKGMLQRGVDVAALDTSYVSSLSWYFFIMISCSGLIGLANYLFGAEDEATAGIGSGEVMMMATGGASAMMPGGAGGVDLKKQLDSERENLQVLAHDEHFLHNAETELLELWDSQQ